MNYINFLDLCNSNSIKRLFSLLGYLSNFIKIIVPILIIVFGIIDLVKSIISGDSDNKNIKIFVKRLILGIIVFFIFPFVTFIFNLINIDNNNQCMSCFVNYDKREICNYIFNSKKIKIKNNTNIICSDSTDKNSCCQEKYGNNDSDGIWIYNDDIGCKNTTPSIK